MLQRGGAAPTDIEKALERLNAAPDGVLVNVATGIDILKSTATPVFPALSSQEIDPLALLKIAYEFLSLNIRVAIFHQHFDPARFSLLTKGTIPQACSIEAGRARTWGYQPFHGLAIRNVADGLTVKIRLFGYLSYNIMFRGVQVPEDKAHRYYLQLDTQEESWK